MERRRKHMATVRFSQQLQDDIVKNAERMFDESIKQAIDNFPKDWGKKLYDSLFSADIQAKMNALPDGFFGKIDQLPLTGFKNAPEDVWQTATTKVDTWKRVDLKLELPSSLPFPPKEVWQRACDSGYYMEYSRNELDFNNEKFEWLHEPFRKYTQGIFSAVAKKDSFVDGVKSIITTYTTLAPALKAWQPLWDLLPDDAKERHKKITEKPKPKSAEDIGVDLNSMTAQVTFNKLTRK